MALVLEERSTSKFLGRNDAIKVLKKENELLESRKTKLSAEVVELANLCLEVGGLRTNREKVDTEVVELRKQAENAKGAEALTVERALKDSETFENLCLELDAERQSSLSSVAAAQPSIHMPEGYRGASTNYHLGLRCCTRRVWWHHLRLTRGAKCLQPAFLVEGALGETSCLRRRHG
jgi:hypothetical protein